MLGDQGCAVEGCEKKHSGRGWCDLHYQRWKATGDPLGMKPTRAEHASNWAGDQIGYSGAHQRLVRARGRASDHTCVCGAPARQWAFQTTSIEVMPYSPDPDAYTAMCVPCHKTYDLARLGGRSPIIPPAGPPE